MLSQLRSVDEAEVAQRFCLLGVLCVRDQQRAVWAINIALWRAHDLLNAFDFVAVPLPDFGGVYACHGFTVPKPKPCKQSFGLRPDLAQGLALLAQMRACGGVTWCKRAGDSSNHRPTLIPCRLSCGFLRLPVTGRGWAGSSGLFISHLFSFAARGCLVGVLLLLVTRYLKQIAP